MHIFARCQCGAWVPVIVRACAGPGGTCANTDLPKRFHDVLEKCEARVNRQNQKEDGKALKRKQCTTALVTKRVSLTHFTYSCRLPEAGRPLHRPPPSPPC